MHKLPLFTFLLGAALHSASALQGSPLAASTPAAVQSPAQQHIAAAQRQIAADPKRAPTYNDLALAYIRRARETGDLATYKDAQTALNKGLLLAPTDFQLQKTAVALLLAQERFPEALDKARLLNKRVPDDVTVYGYMAEADIALGNYPAADTSAQRMINMRPNNIAGLLQGAQLRVLYGDAPGALEFLNQAFGETPQIEPEEQAWIANRIATVELGAGQLDAAAQALARAEELFPHSPVTIANLARLRLAQHKPADAIALLEPRLAQQQAAHISPTETLDLLAQAQQQAGMPGASATFARFQQSAASESALPANQNIALILYDAGLPGLSPANAAAALSLAEREISSRHDVDTLDAYAWALYANGKYGEADAQVQKALAVGIRSAQIEEHAGEIARKLSKPEQAAQYFASALQADAASPYADLARRQLGAQQPSVAAAPPPTVDQPAPTQAAPTVIPVQETHDTGGIPTALLIPRPTGTDRIVRKMQAHVTAHPGEAAGYSELGAAFFQRARETGDVEDYQLAEQALTKSLDLVSTDLSATAPLETMAEVCMGEHRFTDALSYAQKALALGSGDLSAFAIVGDAYADMGEYAKASIAYSRLQPVTSATPLEAREAYAQQARTAYLKFVSGDTEAAITEMKTAIGEGIAAQLPSENLAWLYFELGEFRYQAGHVPTAADAYLTALTIDPGNYRALAGLGKVRASQGKYKEAITLYQSAIAVVPYPLYVAELSDIYTATGDTANAEKQYKLVEYIGLLGHINQVLHNRDLALFYADHDIKLPEALALAHKEFEVRSDIYTWDALAWALYKNGKYPEADEAMSHALRLGTRDAMLLFHAGMISAKLGRDTQAATQLNEAIQINPHFQVLDAATASQELTVLHKQPALAPGAAATTALTAASRGKTHDAQ